MGGYTDIIGRRGVPNGPAVLSPIPAGMVDCSDPALTRPTFTWDLGDYDKFKVFMGSSPGFEKGARATSGKKKITTGSWMPNKKKWKNACKKAVSQAADPNTFVSRIVFQANDGVPLFVESGALEAEGTSEGLPLDFEICVDDDHRRGGVWPA